MSSGQWFMFWLLFLTFSQWIIYAKVREWWRSRHPEPKQGKPVDRVLWHLISDYETPWDAGTSWERVGRGYIVALERQGLYELLDEHDVSDHKPAYTLGYCVREETDRKEIDRLTKQLQRREEALQRKQGEIDSLRQKLAQRPSETPQRQQRQQRQEPAPLDPLREAWIEWGASPDGIDAIMQRKGWQRIAAPAPVAVNQTDEANEPNHTQSEEPEDSTQSVAQYADLTPEERTAEMVRLKDEGKSYREIAQLFGVTEGSAKGAISRGRKAQKSNVVHLFGECSEGVRAVP